MDVLRNFIMEILQSKLRIVVLLLLAPVIVSCSLQRGGLAQPIDTWDVKPQFFCPAESTVEVSWNLHAGLDRRNCQERCRYLSDCSVGAICLDGVCRFRPPPGDPFGDLTAGCAPDTEFTVSSSEDGVIVNHSHDSSGVRSVSPHGTVTFTANGGYRHPLTFYSTETKTATMVRPNTTSIPLLFPFQCPNSWGSYNIDISGPTSSEHVAIARVRNTSGRAIILTGANNDGPPVRLRNGESTTVFNGKVKGVWTAEIPPEFRVGLPQPMCTPTAIENPLPDLSVELELVCSVSP